MIVKAVFIMINMILQEKLKAKIATANQPS